MKSYTTAAFGIAVKIWLVAVVLNALTDTIILDVTTGDLTEGFGIFIYILLIGGVFSIPVFLLLWIITDFKLYGGSSAQSIFKILILSGTIATGITWAVFMFIFHIYEKEIYYLSLVGIASGIAAISAFYSAIKNACQLRDAERIHLADLATASA